MFICESVRIIQMWQFGRLVIDDINGGDESHHLFFSIFVLTCQDVFDMMCISKKERIRMKCQI